MDYREKWFAANKSDHGWYTCAKCGKKIRKKDVDIDHIFPQKYKEFDSLANLQCLCKHCNRSKQAKLKGVPTNLVKHNAKRLKNHVKKKIQNGIRSASDALISVFD